MPRRVAAVRVSSTHLALGASVAAAAACVLLLCSVGFSSLAPPASTPRRPSSGRCARASSRSARQIHADAERRDALTGQLKQADLQIQSARERLAAVRARRIDSEQKLAGLKAEQARTQREVADERGALAAELKVAYMNGRQEQLKLLLNQRDPAAVGRMMAYYGYFGRARAERITSITEHLAHLELLSEGIAAETARLREHRGRRTRATCGRSPAHASGARRRSRRCRRNCRTRNDRAGAGCSRTHRRWKSWSSSCGARSRNFPSWRNSRSSA